MKIKTRSLSSVSFCLLLIMLFTLSCEKLSSRGKNISISEEYATKKAKEFCERFNIRCNGIKKSEVQKGLDHPGGVLFWMFQGEYSRLHLLDEYFQGIKLYFDQQSSRDNAAADCIFFIITEKSKEVEIYENAALYEFYRKKYWSGKFGRAVWPEYITEEKAKKVFDSIGNKLKIPLDMVFEKIMKNKKGIDNQEIGLWSAIWLRKKNGYKYEGDAISMSIMGATGEFVAYSKTYRGVPTSTEMNISKEEAIEIGWRKLQKYFTWKMQRIGEKARVLYAVDAEPLIIQTGPFGPGFKLIKIEGSKLAWVIRYTFTGGFQDPRRSIRKYASDAEKTEVYNAYFIPRDKKWREFGAPDEYFEVRIDAATGKILYRSPMRPWYIRWFGELTIKR